MDGDCFQSPFPLLLCVDIRQCSFVGYVGPSGHRDRYEFVLQLESPRDMSTAKVQCSSGFTELLGDTGMSLLQKRMASSPSVSDFLVELDDLIERAEREKHELSVDKAAISSVASAEICSRLVAELEGLWGQLGSVHPSLTSFQLIFNDSHKRKHRIDIKLPDQYPKIAPICTMEAPEEIQLRWNETNNIRDVLKQFSSAAEKYNALWEQLDEIDQNTWVLEPDKPSYSITTRRIALENHCSLSIELDVKAPKKVPTCKFLGSDQRISSLRSRLQSNYRLWDEEKSVRANLAKVLEISFPEKPASEEESDMECAICYAYKMGQQIPDQTCENKKCQKAFHHSCLFEWLRAASSRTTFDTLFGSCPNCFENISVKAIK